MDASSAPERIAETLEISATIRRLGERHGPPDGALIGVRYTAPHFTIEAKRRDARVCLLSGSDLYLEPGDEDFLEAVVSASSSGYLSSANE